MSVLVSVVMPCFNAEKYLSESIDSILRQTHRDIELVAVDDGSTDGTAAILRAVTDPRLVMLQSERNEGIVAALNRGFAAARGEFIARMDADDVAEPTRLERQLACFAADPDLAVLGTGVSYIDAGGGALRSPRLPPETVAGMRWRLLTSNALHHPTVMFRRAAIALPLYAEGFPDIEDWELWLRLADSRKLRGLSARLLRHRRYADSVSGRRHESQLQGVSRLLQSHLVRVFGIELPVSECRGLCDPPFWIREGVTGSSSPIDTLRQLYRTVVPALPDLTDAAHREIECDLAFFALRCIAISLATPQPVSATGCALRRRTLIVEALKILAGRPAATLAALRG